MNIIQSLLIVFLVFCSATVLLVTISTFIMLYDDIKYKYGYYEEGDDEERWDQFSGRESILKNNLAFETEEGAIERAVELGWREKT